MMRLLMRSWTSLGGCCVVGPGPGLPLDHVRVFVRGNCRHPDHGCRDGFPSFDYWQVNGYDGAHQIAVRCGCDESGRR